MNSSIITAIRIINRNNEEAIKNRIHSLGKVATGVTISGVNSKIVIDGELASGEIYAPHNSKYTGSQYNFLESGRKPGAKMMPVTKDGVDGPLVPWMKARGILPAYEYPIAKKIAKDGVPAVDITKSAIKTTASINLKAAADGHRADIKEQIRKALIEQ